MLGSCFVSENVYSDLDTFREDVLNYLVAESQYVDKDIQSHNEIAPAEKEALGLLVRGATRVNIHGTDSIMYETPVNFTKLRPGDEVRICEAGDPSGGRAVVDENAIEHMSFTAVSELAPKTFPERADIVVHEQNNLDSIISVVRDIKEGGQGLNLMKMFGGLLEPRREARFGRITDFCDEEIPETFNEGQRLAVKMAMRRPSLAFVQGIPGSGKTHLLAVVARGYARRSKDVAVIALTHQAVNNALNKIRKVDSDIPVVKVGKLFKNLDLDESVAQAETFLDYLAKRKSEGHFFGRLGHVVGMTFQAALYNLGKLKSPFIPQIVLFDEASQLPLTHAIAVGAFGCGSVIFIGDDVQMPPIYHEKLSRNRLSVSVFERIKALYPQNGQVLNVTYRMNSEIANFVGDRFYRPRGIQLLCSKHSARRHLDSPVIEFITCSSPGARDENGVEAAVAIDVVRRYLDSGMSSCRLAVITPYRRQVRMIHKLLVESYPGNPALPMVDTVERLQGQDVDVIIISFVTDDISFFNTQKSFLLNFNRLNVMFSRATSKVVVISGQLVREGLNAIPVCGFKGGQAAIPVERIAH